MEPSPKEIVLTNGMVAIVDESDHAYLSQWKWSSCHGYASRTERVKDSDGVGKNVCVFMHRVIAGTPKGMATDHIDGNPLNNRRSNLRVCSQSENAKNHRKKRANTASVYKGVTWHARDERWQAQIKVNYQFKHLGNFKNEDDAATAYNMAALREFRQFASLNLIPHNHPAQRPRFE